MLKRKFDIFEIEYNETDLEYIESLMNCLVNNYKEIMNFFEIKTFNKTVQIKLWSSKEEYRNYFNELYKEKGYNNKVPKWEVARSFSDNGPKIYLMSYKESIKCKGHLKDTLASLFKIIVHEFVHTCHFEYNNHTETLTWLSEALATNLSHQYEEQPLKLNASLEEVINGKTSYSNYYAMGKYLLDTYSKAYILELTKNNELLENETPNIYNETIKYIVEKNNKLL